MRLTHALYIAAPVDKVWAATIDIERWPEWTPTVTSVERLDVGSLTVGSSARLKQPGLPAAVWTVSEFECNERFAWETSLLGMHMVASHEFAADSAGTRNELSIRFDGWVARLLWPVIRSQASAALAKENHGLKAFCESPAGDQ